MLPMYLLPLHTTLVGEKEAKETRQGEGESLTLTQIIIMLI